jgi:hypothetical protein
MIISLTAISFARGGSDWRRPAHKGKGAGRLTGAPPFLSVLIARDQYLNCSSTPQVRGGVRVGVCVIRPEAVCRPFGVMLIA